MSGKRGKPVSEQEFRRMWRDTSLTTDEIGRRLGIRATSVCRRAWVRGLPNRHDLRREAKEKTIDDLRQRVAELEALVKELKRRGR